MAAGRLLGSARSSSVRGWWDGGLLVTVGDLTTPFLHKDVFTDRTSRHDAGSNGHDDFVVCFLNTLSTSEAVTTRTANPEKR
jgi:hypothetical protein